MINAMLLPKKSFISTWKTDNAGTSSSTQITVPTTSTGTYNCTVNWGDGTSSRITTWNDAAWTHTYPVAGTYKVSISGIFTGIRFNNLGDRRKILNISQWGVSKFTSQDSLFTGCSNLTITATDTPDLSGTTTLEKLFEGCAAITTIPNLSSWKVSTITNFSATFRSCSNFNQSVSGWDVSNGTTFNSTFSGCSSFNQSLTTWNVSSVCTSVAFMFFGCSVFNQPISHFTTTNVTDMRSVFQSASVFNQDISGWDVSKVTNMSNMFNLAVAFNQGLDSWDVSKVTNMADMFNLAISFNGDITSWDIGLVTSISGMFFGTPFNQDIGAWNTANVTNMSGVFWGNSVFNQDIGGWNTAKVTTMTSMFRNCTAFNQDISSWSIAALTSAATMFTSSGFNITNYDLLLDNTTGWPSQTTIQSGVTFSAGNAHYSAGAPTTGRAILTGTYNWTITDGGTP